jgi:DNA-binding response OmpR family regulator
MSRILVVEDEALIAPMIGEWLSERGYVSIGPAATVASAMALIDQSVPGDVILDVSLGRETSFPIADRLTTMGVPFVFATGHSDSSLPARFHGSLTLSKPFDFDALGRAITMFATGRSPA